MFAHTFETPFATLCSLWLSSSILSLLEKFFITTNTIAVFVNPIYLSWNDFSVIPPDQMGFVLHGLVISIQCRPAEHVGSVRIAYSMSRQWKKNLGLYAHNQTQSLPLAMTNLIHPHVNQVPDLTMIVFYLMSHLVSVLQSRDSIIEYYKPTRTYSLIWIPGKVIIINNYFEFIATTEQKSSKFPDCNNNSVEKQMTACCRTEQFDHTIWDNPACAFLVKKKKKIIFIPAFIQLQQIWLLCFSFAPSATFDDLGTVYLFNSVRQNSYTTNPVIGFKYTANYYKLSLLSLLPAWKPPLCRQKLTH